MVWISQAAVILPFHGIVEKEETIFNVCTVLI